MSIAFKWTDYAVPSVLLSVTSHCEIQRDSCLSFLERFCVAILCNVTLHTCNIHIHEIKAVNTTIMTIIMDNNDTVLSYFTKG